MSFRVARNNGNDEREATGQTVEDAARGEEMIREANYQVIYEPPHTGQQLPSQSFFNLLLIFDKDFAEG
jgi:hypothetical protein